MKQFGEPTDGKFGGFCADISGPYHNGLIKIFSIFLLIMCPKSLFILESDPKWNNVIVRFDTLAPKLISIIVFRSCMERKTKKEEVVNFKTPSMYTLPTLSRENNILTAIHYHCSCRMRDPTL